MSVFSIVPDMNLQTILDIPDTQYMLQWNGTDRAYEVIDICGWKHHFLTHQIRRMLKCYNTASTFPMIGKVVQRYAKAFAA